jgi:cytochrome bd-type quinol oxidase subunit 2
MDSDANLVVAQKTRRAVRDAVISTQEQRVRQRRSLGLAIIGFVSLLVMLGPALWNGMEDLLAGERLFDLPTLLAFSALMFFLAMLAALIAVWKGRRDVEHDRGGFEIFRPIEK